AEGQRPARACRCLPQPPVVARGRRSSSRHLRRKRPHSAHVTFPHIGPRQLVGLLRQDRSPIRSAEHLLPSYVARPSHCSRVISYSTSPSSRPSTGPVMEGGNAPT